MYELPPSVDGSLVKLPTILSPAPFHKKLLNEVSLSFVIRTIPFITEASVAVLTCVTFAVGL